MLKNLLTLFVFSLFLLPAELLAQPANDDCANAIDIAPGTGFEFSTIDANSDGPNHPNDCTSSGDTPDSIYHDVWYRFAPDFTGVAQFSTCGTADFDTKIIVYAPGSSCPPTDTDLIACNEDGPGCENSTSSATFDVVSGETYLLRLGGWGDSESGGQSGEGTFSAVEFDPGGGPENQFCMDATVLTLDDNDFLMVQFTTIDAITSPPDYSVTFSCFDVPNNETTVFNDIWYSWTPTFTGFAEWSNCGTSTFDSRMAVYGPDQPCPPDTLALVGCSDDGVNEIGANCPGFTSRAVFEVTEGATYLLNLGGWSSNGAGTGSFTLKKVPSPIFPDNDECMDAFQAMVITAAQADDFDFFSEGFTINATAEGTTPNPSCRSSGEFADVWYKFNSGENTEIELRFFGNTSGSEYIINLYDGCATETDTDAGGFCIRTDLISDDVFVENLEGFSGVPTEYLLRVSSRITTDAPGEFFLQLVGTPFTNVEELETEGFKFFPNPVSDRLNISFQLKESTNAEIGIINFLGQQVQQEAVDNFSLGLNEFSMDVSQLQTGIYFLKIHTQKGDKTFRFVKQ